MSRFEGMRCWVESIIDGGLISVADMVCGELNLCVLHTADIENEISLEIKEVNVTVHNIQGIAIALPDDLKTIVFNELFDRYEALQNIKAAKQHGLAGDYAAECRAQDKIDHAEHGAFL